MVSKVTIDLQSLSELKEQYSTPKLQKSIANGLFNSVMDVNKTIRDSVTSRYRISVKEFERVRIGKLRSVLSQSNKFMEIGLSYEVLPRRLINQYTYTPEWGNINQGASRKGWITHSTIYRMNKQINYGELHYGGFYQKAGANTRYSNIFERQQQATWLSKGVRAPIKVLFAPSIATFIVSRMKHDPKIQESIDRANLFIQELL